MHFYPDSRHEYTICVGVCYTYHDIGFVAKRVCELTSLLNTVTGTSLFMGVALVYGCVIDDENVSVTVDEFGMT